VRSSDLNRPAERESAVVPPAEKALSLGDRGGVRRGKLPGNPRNGQQRFMKVSSFIAIFFLVAEAGQ